MEFEDLQQVAISKQKLIMQKSELIFPSIKIVTLNSNRSNLAEILDSIANNNQQSEVEFLKEKSFRHSLDSKKLIFAAKKFPVGYQKNLIENLIQEKNPAIFCGFNCNFKGSIHKPRGHFAVENVAKKYLKNCREVAEEMKKM